MGLTFVAIFLSPISNIYFPLLGAETVSQKFLEKYPSRCHFDFKFGLSMPELYRIVQIFPVCKDQNK